MKNILSIHPFIISRGGSQRYFLEIAKVLKEKNNNVKLYTHTLDKENSYKDNSLINYIKFFKKIKFHKYKIRKIKKIFDYIEKPISLFGIDILVKYIRNLLIAKQIVKICSIKNIDLIILHEEPISYMVSYFLQKKNKKIKVYLICYDSIYKWFYLWKDYKSNFYFFRNIILKLILKIDKIFLLHISKIFVLDKNIKRIIKDVYGLNSKVIGGGVSEINLSFKKNKYLKNKYKLKQKIIISCVTRINKQKKILELVFFFIKYFNNSNDVCLYINATEEDQLLKSKIVRIISDARCKNIIFDTIQFENDKDLYNVYRSSDMFIYPSINQTWGHAALEASSLGCLSIINSRSGISKILNIESRNTFNNFDSKLYEKINYYINNIEQIRRDSIEQKKIIRKNYTWQKIIEKIGL